MKINLKSLINEEEAPTTTPTTTPAAVPASGSTDTKFGTFNISTLKSVIPLDNETYFTSALTKIKNNQIKKLSTQENAEVASFFDKLLKLDDINKTKVFNLLKQNAKVTK